MSNPDTKELALLWEAIAKMERYKELFPCGDPNHDIYGAPCPCTGEKDED
jgi:hypothetical protein